MSSTIHTHYRSSWAVIFGGAILVVAVQLLLSLLGAGIGFGTVNLNAGTSSDASIIALASSSYVAV